ncbi:MAG: hypothetical protein COW34_00815 [Armatimonadetes bacterium CG17_big_fil_post_rev_8_21_14_2_50_66_6]|nr:MAG: hypothetical protein COW34_00815 [Armatimonadetes bacterium CG17_big_fil_post_rev_8_21_14_2_50_66_6]
MPALTCRLSPTSRTISGATTFPTAFTPWSKRTPVCGACRQRSMKIGPETARTTLETVTRNQPAAMPQSAAPGDGRTAANNTMPANPQTVPSLMNEVRLSVPRKRTVAHRLSAPAPNPIRLIQSPSCARETPISSWRVSRSGPISGAPMVPPMRSSTSRLA